MGEPDTSPIAFVGGRILSMDPRHPDPDAVIVEDGRITAVGPREMLRAFPTARVRDLAGRTLLPGFIDAHNHLCIAALHPVWADLSRVRDEDELRDALRAQAEREPDARWVRGVGWNEVTTGLQPDRAALDRLGLDRPVILAHYSLHQCVVSSQGLDELGIGKATRDPHGGIIERDERGVPTGLLVERAWSEAHARSLAEYRHPDRWGELVARRARALLADGITCIHDAACPPSAEALYFGMARDGTLPISVLTLPHPEALLMPLSAERLDGPLTGEGDERVRVGPIKLFADGGVLPAIDTSVDGERFQTGTCFADLAEGVLLAHTRGFRVAVHAIGNRGLEAALDAFRRAADARSRSDPRFRVEHASLASKEQIRTMAELGVVGVVQPGFLHHMGEAIEQVPFDGDPWMPFGDMARAGVPLAASSDDPCAFHEPLRTSAHGATRITGSGGVLGPEQSIEYLDWLRAYTAGAAWAGGQEDERGSLSPGKRADLVVLEGDLDPADPPAVVETWVGGARRFAQPAPTGAGARSVGA